MSATVAGATGNPDPFEQPPQSERPDYAHYRENHAHLQVLRQRRMQPEDREDQDLRDHRDAMADDHDSFDNRHEARLFHAASGGAANGLVRSSEGKNSQLRI